MTRTILLADDSVTIQKVVELTFMDEDYQVVSVSNGNDALDQLHEVSPDLVIADVHMPGANGYEVCRKAKQMRDDLPVLLLVGTFEAFNEEESRNCGAAGYLKKPFDSQELLRRVGSLLTEKISLGGAGSSASEDAMAARPLSPGSVDPPLSRPVTPVAEEPAADIDVGFSVGPLELPDLPPDVRPEEALSPADPIAYAEPLHAEPVSISEPAPASDALLDPLVHREPSPVSEAEAASPGALSEPFPAPEPRGRPQPAVVSETASSPQTNGSQAASGPASQAVPATSGGLSEEQVEQLAQRVAEIIGEKVAREIAWEVIPDLAEVIIRDRLRELESQVEKP